MCNPRCELNSQKQWVSDSHPEKLNLFSLVLGRPPHTRAHSAFSSGGEYKSVPNAFLARGFLAKISAILLRRGVNVSSNLSYIWSTYFSPTLAC
jgi:hypothetical protein